MGSPPRSAPSETEFRTLLAEGSGSNVAATTDSSSDARLRPRLVRQAPTEVRAALVRAVRGMNRWRVVDSSGAVLWLTRTTRLFRFVDDLFVLVAPRGEGSVLLVRSASRVGRSDLGQNRRNIAELWAGLERAGGLQLIVGLPDSAKGP